MVGGGPHFDFSPVPSPHACCTLYLVVIAYIRSLLCSKKSSHPICSRNIYIPKSRDHSILCMCSSNIELLVHIYTAGASWLAAIPPLSLHRLRGRYPEGYLHNRQPNPY